MMSYFLKTVQSSIIQQKQSFSPGLLFYVCIESPNPKKSLKGPTPQDPNSINWKPQPQNPLQDPNLQTMINEQ